MPEVGLGTMTKRKQGAGTLRRAQRRQHVPAWHAQQWDQAQMPFDPKSLHAPVSALFLPGQQWAARTQRKGRGSPGRAFCDIGIMGQSLSPLTWGVGPSSLL